MISKSDLRKQFIEKRKNLDIKRSSILICQKIRELAVYKNAKNIFAFYPKPYEVDISSLIEDKTKTWFLPKVIKENMAFYEYLDKLEQGTFGVMEPTGNIQTNIIPDLIIVPALCVDKRGYRLGYGKGYYDRFLAEFDNAPKTLTPVFSELIVDILPIEATDKKIDIIVSA